MLFEVASRAGSVTVMLVVAVHPFASVTVYVYVPAVTVKSPVPVYGPVPPVADTVTVDEPPLHEIGVDDELATNTAGSVTVMLVVAVHPLASVTVYVYVPAVTVKSPVPVYGPVPPVADTVTVDDPPLHKIAVDDELATNAVGSVTMMLVVAAHPLASVTV